MGPDMTILECICQVVVFWAVCLGGWVTVRIIECGKNCGKNCSKKCNRNCRKKCGKKCVTAERRAA